MESGRRWASSLQTPVLRKHFWTHNFSVSLVLDELANVPRVTGWLYCKVRLLDGAFREESSRQEVQHNTVQWGKIFEFECRATVNSLTGILQNSMCRLSVRKDIQGGKSYKKVGYVDLNLSEFAGSGHVTQNYLLQGYTNSDKLDNSILKVGLLMQLLHGDPCFRVPPQQSLTRNMWACGKTELLHETSSDSDSEPGSSEDTRRRQSMVSFPDLLEVLPGQTAEAQERARVAGQLARVGRTRVDARGVVESLCLEGLASLTGLPPTLEDAGLALFVGQDGTTTLGLANAQNRDSGAEDLDNVIIMK